MMIKCLAGVAMLLVSGTAYANSGMQAGQWEMQTVVLQAAIPGLDGQALSMMKQPRSTKVCITQEQAQKGPKAFLEKQDGRCNFTEYRFDGGQIDAIMKCDGPEGRLTATTKGKYSATTYEATTAMVTSSSMGDVRITTKASGKRLGACSGK